MLMHVHAVIATVYRVLQHSFKCFKGTAGLRFHPYIIVVIMSTTGSWSIWMTVCCGQASACGL